MLPSNRIKFTPEKDERKKLNGLMKTYSRGEPCNGPVFEDGVKSS